VLGPLLSSPALVSGPLDVTFLGSWSTEPTSRPFVTQLGGNMAQIEWTRLTDGDPAGGAIVRINLQFVPEPGTAALLGLGLAGLGVVGRSSRQETKATT
jgi:hypothetical protein